MLRTAILYTLADLCLETVFATVSKVFAIPVHAIGLDMVVGCVYRIYNTDSEVVDGLCVSNHAHEQLITVDVRGQQIYDRFGIQEVSLAYDNILAYVQMDSIYGDRD